MLDCSIKDDLTGKFEGLDALIHLAGNPSPAAPEQKINLPTTEDLENMGCPGGTWG